MDPARDRNPAAATLSRQSADLVSALTNGAPIQAGWLALDLADTLLRQAKLSCGATLTPEQQDELDWLTDRLRALASEI